MLDIFVQVVLSLSVKVISDKPYCLPPLSLKEAFFYNRFRYPDCSINGGLSYQVQHNMPNPVLIVLSERLAVDVYPQGHGFGKWLLSASHRIINLAEPAGITPEHFMSVLVCSARCGS